MNNVAERAGYANQWYMTLGGMTVLEAGTTIPQSPSETAPYTQGGLEGEGYWPPRVLEFGMSGPDVVALQGLLIAHDYPAGITGTFDNPTRLMLMAFQGEHGLKTDGIAGPLTWAALTRR